MRTILINYKGTQVTTSIKTEWNELDWGDLKFIIEHFFGNLTRIYETGLNERKEKQVHVKDAVLLRSVIAGITYKLWDVKPNVFKEITGEELDKLIDMYLPISFLFEGNKFTKCPIKKVFYMGLFYGPGDDFSTIDFEEYCYADSQYYKFNALKKEEDLDLLAAILMRPKSWNPNGIDKRIPFHPQLVEKRLGMARHMSMEKKMALYLWWEGCKNKQAGLYKRFFGGGGSSKGSGGGSMFSAMMAMSKDIFGTFEQTKRVNCKVAFARMEQLLQEAEERE
jgi:hypothetical protein